MSITDNDELGCPVPLPHEAESRAPSDLSDSDNLLNLANALKRYRFTPIIGPECSTIGRSETPSWKTMESHFVSLFRAFAPHEQQARHFLQSFAHAHGVILEPDPEPVPIPKALQDFRKTLLLLIQALSQFFADDMSQSSQLLEPGEPTIAISGAKAFSLRSLLLEACDGAFELKSTQALVGLLDLQDIYRRMTDLTQVLTHGYFPAELKSEFARKAFFRDIRSKENTLEIDVEVNLLQLYWLSDLLWHTFCAALEIYPTDSELAFMAAIGVPSIEARPELVHATQHHVHATQHQQLDSAETIADWFKRYRAGSEARRDSPVTDAATQFYDKIANYLKSQFSNLANPDASISLESVAFATSLDLELEEALKRARVDQPFHVAIPIRAYARGEKGPEETFLCWLLGTIQHDKPVDRPVWQWLPNTADLTAYLKGPLVVKLHGSPLHKLPRATDPLLEQQGGREYRAFGHALTLSETDYLKYIVLLKAVPKFFNSVFNEKERVFFFLGHPVNEWNVRLRIFDRVYPLREQNPAPRTMIAISPHFDAFTSAPLGALGVERWQGSLEDFTTYLP